MPLQSKFTAEADIPAEQKPFYKKNGEAWVLDVTGMVDNSQLDEFRTNNRAVMSMLGAKNMDEVKSKLEKLKDVDPELYSTLKKAHDDAHGTKLLSEGKVDELVEKRTKEMKSANEKTLGEKDTQIATLQQALATELIDGRIATIAASKGVRAGAILDVQARGRTVFKLEDGKVFGYGTDGNKRHNGKGDPFSIQDWLDEIAANKDNEHLFEPNRGSGATNQRGGNTGGTIKNPWLKDNVNLTQQGVLLRTKPELARQFKAEAGVK